MIDHRNRLAEKYNSVKVYLSLFRESKLVKKLSNENEGMPEISNDFFTVQLISATEVMDPKALCHIMSD